MSGRLLACAAAAILAFSGSAHATVFVFQGVMLGSNENPPNASPATGFTSVTLDDVTDLLDVDVTWSGLTAPAAAAHIHCCTAPGTNIGVAIPFTAFPAATSGHYVNTFDLTMAATYTSSFLTNFGGGTAAGAETALLNGLLAGRAYSNIHDANFPGGEIRTFLQPVPEPASWALMLSGFGVLGAWLRRRRAVPAPA